MRYDLYVWFILTILLVLIGILDIIKKEDITMETEVTSIVGE